MNAIPSIDVGAFIRRHEPGASPASIHQVVREVADACERVGFLVIREHGLPVSTLKGLLTLSEAFFEQPQAHKDRWHPQGAARQRGYHGSETRGLAATLGTRAPLDLRESLFMGPVEDHRAYFAASADAETAYAANIYPDQPAGLPAALVQAYQAFESLAADLLKLFALALETDEHFFEDKIQRHFSILASHYYPPLPEAPLPGQLRTGAHTDFGAFTILAMTRAATGLEVHAGGDRWLPVQPGPGELVVNLGDMMARWTNDRWVSTLHRVANPTKLNDIASRRQTIGYFMHPDYDAKIESLASCVPQGQATNYQAITAGAHIRAKIDRSHEVGGPAAHGQVES